MLSFDALNELNLKKITDHHKTFLEKISQTLTRSTSEGTNLTFKSEEEETIQDKLRNLLDEVNK